MVSRALIGRLPAPAAGFRLRVSAAHTRLSPAHPASKHSMGSDELQGFKKGGEIKYQVRCRWKTSAHFYHLMAGRQQPLLHLHDQLKVVHSTHPDHGSVTCCTHLRGRKASRVACDGLCTVLAVLSHAYSQSCRPRLAALRCCIPLPHAAMREPQGLAFAAGRRTYLPS